MKKYFTKFLDLIKSHKKISVAALLVLVFCLAGGIWFAQAGKRNKAVLADKASAEKAELSVKSVSKGKNEKADSAEDRKPDDGSGEGSAQTDENASQSTNLTERSTTSENSDTTAETSSGSSSKEASANNGSDQKSNTSKASSAPSKKTNSNSQTAKPTQPAQPTKPSGHYETRQVLVQAAYDEPIYETQVVGAKCNTCGQVFSTFEAWEAHSDSMIDQGDTNHMSYSGVYGQVQTGTKHHDAVYKTEQVWVQE